MNSFLVSWFLVFWFRSFLVSKFQSIKNHFILAELHFVVSGRYWSHIQAFHEFIKRIAGIFRHASFPRLSKWLSEFDICKEMFFEVNWDCSSICSGILGAPKINNTGFGAQGHVQKSRNHRNDGFEGSHICKSKSYKCKMEQNNTTEHLSISFPWTYHENNAKVANNQKMQGRPDFSRFYWEFVLTLPEGLE